MPVCRLEELQSQCVTSYTPNLLIIKRIIDVASQKQFNCIMSSDVGIQCREIAASLDIHYVKACGIKQKSYKVWLSYT